MKPAEISLIGNGFSEFWSKFPKKVAKRDAEKAWGKIKMSPTLCERILKAIDDQITSVWRGKDKEFIPHAATWLRGERWNDTADLESHGELQERQHGMHFCRACKPAHEWKSDDPFDTTEYERFCPVEIEAMKLASRRTG